MTDPTAEDAAVGRISTTGMPTGPGNTSVALPTANLHRVYACRVAGVQPFRLVDLRGMTLEQAADDLRRRWPGREILQLEPVL